MRVMISKQPLSRVLKSGQLALFCCAALFLGYCDFALAAASIFQKVENRDLDRVLLERRAMGGTPAGRPNNVAVLAPSSENMLALVTCYPFFFVGAAPKRFVVRARQAPAGSVVE